MNNTISSNENKFRNLRDKLIIIFVVLVVCTTFVLSLSVLDKSTKAIRNNAADLIAANSGQLLINIDSYFLKVESTVALLFSDESYYKYDKTNNYLDEYTKLQREKAISDKIVDLGIMENFSDFGIVYSDNSTVGWISNTTKSNFDTNTFYDNLSSHIVNVKTNDGWFSGVNDSYDRLYYVKRLNDNAVVLASFYSRELASVFKFPEELDGMVIRLINDDQVVLYSSEKDEIGTVLPSDISNIIGDNQSILSVDDKYIINVGCCENSWRSVCVMPTSVVLADVNSLKTFTFTLSMILAASIILFGVIIFNSISKPMDNIVLDLEEKATQDGLSGLLNKVSYEKNVEEELHNTIIGSSVAIVVLDVDHFKTINDTNGHAYGDQVIVRTADVIRRILPKEAIVGRIGGDEFSFTIKAVEKDVSELKIYMQEIADELMSEFLKEFEEEHKKYDVSISLGIYIFEHHEEQFNDVYKNADSALYASKENGRGKCSFYKEVANND